MLTSIIVGLLLTVVTITIHATGTIFWTNYLKRRGRHPTFRSTGLMRLRLLCATAIALLILHIIEVIVWGSAYLLLIGGESFTDIEGAIYFSMVTFASLGYPTNYAQTLDSYSLGLEPLLN